jgi:aspartyl protease family protein
MLGRYIAFAVGVCGFAAVVTSPSPDGEMGSSIDSSNSFKLQQSKQQSQASAGWFSGDHALERSSDGHFYATAYVSGTPVRMMVDTGASVIALTSSDAVAAGLSWDESQVRHIGSGASGAVYGVPMRLSDVEIGGMVRRDVDAVIIPEGLEISLLGQSYLSRLGTVEITGNQMVMSAQ